MEKIIDQTNKKKILVFETLPITCQLRVLCFKVRLWLIMTLFQNQFVVDDVSKIIKEGIENTIGGNAYQHVRNRKIEENHNILIFKTISGQSEQLDRSSCRKLPECIDETAKAVQIYRWVKSPSMTHCINYRELP